MQNFLKAGFVAALFAVVGCGESVVELSEEDQVQESSDALLGGTATKERPEIGRIFFQGSSTCTATLIHPRVVITAKHCVSNGSCDDGLCENARTSFMVPDENGRPAYYLVKNYRSLGVNGNVETGSSGKNKNLSFEEGYALNDDIALLLLRDEVPASQATPAKLATAHPEPGREMTVWGFGCTNRDTKGGGGTKRKINFTQDEKSNVLCPGDSGGPVTDTESGELYYVNSGYWIVSEPWQTDIFGDVVTLRNRVDEQLEAWGIIEGDEPQQPQEPEMDEPQVDDPVDPVEPDAPVCRPFETTPPEAGMPLRVSLLWPEKTDLDLFVQDPAGNKIYYGNRTTAEGAQLKKADCLSSSCPALEDGSDYSEWVEWSGKPLQGEYKVWAVNYDGKAEANFAIMVESDRGNTSFDGVLSYARESSQVWTFTYEDREICE